MGIIFIIAFYALFIIRETVALRGQHHCPNCKCEIQCSTIFDLESRLSYLEKSVGANDAKLLEFVNLQHSVQRMEGSVNNQAKEVKSLTKSVLQQMQNLETLLREMEVEKVDILTVTVTKLQENLQEQKHISSSLQTQLNETDNDSSAERKRLAETLKTMSDIMVDQSINYTISLAGLKQDITSVESKIEPLNSSINTLYKVQSAFNQTLSVNQQNVNALKEDFLNVTDTLTIYEQNVTNMVTELPRAFTIEQQQLYENLTTQIEMWKHYFNNSTVDTLAKLNMLENKLNTMRMNSNNWNTNATTLSVETLPSTENYDSSFTKIESSDETSSNKSGSEGDDCSVPQYYQPPLIARITPTGLRPFNYYNQRFASNGTKLKFGCTSYDNNVLIDPESKKQILGIYTLECVNGIWKGGNFPQCHHYMTTARMKDFKTLLTDQVQKSKRCFFDGRQFNITYYDCSKYILCSEGRLQLHECQSPLVFNLTIGFCQPPLNVDCQQQKNNFDKEGIAYLHSHPNLYYTKAQINLLSTLIPIIQLNPNPMFKNNSTVTVGIVRELFIYPQLNVTLECGFPIPSQSNGTGVTWIVNYFKPSYYKEQLKPHGEFNRFLDLKSVTESDSGIYTCVAPNGKRRELEIIVQAINCPPLRAVPGSVMEPYSEPPENTTSVPMTTVAAYRCRPGYENSESFKQLICTIFGYWSNYFRGDPVNQFDICKKSTKLGKERE